MNSPIISIIIPIYNSERYLENCIDSILYQSFKDFELLLINDGSTDKSGEICDEYAKGDNRVRVFHKENGGVSSARNRGLDEAKGERIYFPDSDDIVFENAFENLIDRTYDNVDYVMGGYEVYNEEDTCIYKIQKNRNKQITKHDALMEMFAPSDYRYQGYLWNKLFKASIINAYSLRFNTNIKFNEDRLFNVEYLCKINGSVSYFTKPVYKYYERSTSAMASLSKKFNPNFITDLYAFVEMKKALIYVNCNKELIYKMKCNMAYSYIRLTKMMKRFNFDNMSLYKESREITIKTIGLYFLNKVYINYYKHKILNYIKIGLIAKKIK